MRQKLFAFIFFMFAYLINGAFAKEKPTHFAVIIPSYNNAQWVTKNLESVVSQTYTNWSLIYIDDCSKDKTGDIVADLIKKHNLQKKCTLIRNEKRCGALANIYKAVHMCNPKHVVVLLDGDDWFAHKKVLKKLASIYANKKIWLTYGNFRSDPPGWESCCAPIPKKVRQHNSFSKHKWVASHLRTFYAKLFHLIKKEDLMINGDFFPMTYDMAITFPMLEMASKNHFFFVRNVLYIYNVANPIMDWRINAELQRKLDAHIRSMPTYKPLNRLF